MPCLVHSLIHFPAPAAEVRPICSGRSDAIFRIEASVRKREPQSPGLKPCSDCLFSSYCSEEHWEAVKSKHQQVPCRDGRDNLSQCDMNKLYVEDIRFALLMSGANAGDFKWTPERTMREWKSLQGVGWNDFASDVEESFGGLPGIRPMMGAVLRGITEGLSMPLTILWALENLNSDDAWTKKETLNIHVRHSVHLSAQFHEYSLTIPRFLVLLRKKSSMPISSKKYYTDFLLSKI